jgi:hypothetical protein
VISVIYEALTRYNGKILITKKKEFWAVQHKQLVNRTLKLKKNE